jgi:hypothetical protein
VRGTKRQPNRNTKEVRTEASTESFMTVGGEHATGSKRVEGRTRQAEQRAEEGPYPHLSQSMAEPPDRSGHPFLQSPPPPAGAAPQAGFMHLFAATTPAMAGGGELTQSCLRSKLKEHLASRERGRESRRWCGGGGVVFRWMWRGQRTKEPTKARHARCCCWERRRLVCMRGTKGTPPPAVVVSARAARGVN